jgi:hypothetical protein
MLKKYPAFSLDVDLKVMKIFLFAGADMVSPRAIVQVTYEVDVRLVAIVMLTSVFVTDSRVTEKVSVGGAKLDAEIV